MNHRVWSNNAAAFDNEHAAGSKIENRCYGSIVLDGFGQVDQSRWTVLNEVRHQFDALIGGDVCAAVLDQSRIVQTRLALDYAFRNKDSSTPDKSRGVLKFKKLQMIGR